MEKYLSTREAAARIGITYNSLMSHLYRGRLKFTRLGKSYAVEVTSVDALARTLGVA